MANDSSRMKRKRPPVVIVPASVAEKRTRAELGRRAGELRRILVEWDVLGIYQDEVRPDDNAEYDDLIWPIISWLSEGIGSADLSANLVHFLSTHYGLESKSASEEIDLSQRLCRWWATHSESG